VWTSKNEKEKKKQLTLLLNSSFFSLFTLPFTSPFTHLTQAHDLTSFVITNPDRNLVYI
jgi:hypothetical protein